MKHTRTNKRKIGAVVVALLLTAVVVFGGTFAWQSISQEALNEVAATVNPGGRLHDDFVETTNTQKDQTRVFNKDVYVENFTEYWDNGVQIYARIRLDEYMELGEKAGTLNADGTGPSETNKAESLVKGAKLEDKSTWTPHVPNNPDDPFHEYWEWSVGGKTTYMPTFNKNKDSLAADINGTFDQNFTDYVDYTLAENSTKTAVAIYDNDDNNIEEPNDETTITKVDETHTAKETITGGVKTMAEWLELFNNDVADDEIGDFWVYDTDGWAYWANPINPETATGLLLNGIKRTETYINQDWYYGINVVAQFITGEDIGFANSTGFYDVEEGTAPTTDALRLLEKIGVDVTYGVSNAEELEEALAHGGEIVLTDNITVDKQLVVSADTTLDLGEFTISNDEAFFSEDNKTWSLISVQGADTVLTIEGGNFIAKADDCYAVDVRDGAKVVINGGTFNGNISAVYVHTGSAVINGGDFSIQQTDLTNDNEYAYLLNVFDANYANGTADITVSGGTFHYFDPANSNDGSYLADGYKSVPNADDGTFTVSAEG